MSKLKIYYDLYSTFFKIGAVTIGGGYVMLPIIQREAVDKHQWVTEEEVLDYYALSQSIPGIIAVNTAALVGYKQKKLPGAIAAALGVITPSILIIMAIAAFCTRFADNPYVQKAFGGIRAAVTAMVIMAVVRMWKKAVVDKTGIFFAILGFFAVVFFRVSPIYMIILGAAAGVLLKYTLKKESKPENQA
jgi:chromate transporter